MSSASIGQLINHYRPVADPTSRPGSSPVRGLSARATEIPPLLVLQSTSAASTMFRALEPNPEDKLHLRLHRARSVVLTSDELVEIRAAQRTFEGAYMRTALSQFSFALIILKIFTSEFYPIGALLAVYGFCILLIAAYRRHEGNRQFFSEDAAPAGHDGAGPARLSPASKKKFRTSGNSVALLAALSLGAYMALLALILTLES
ncbi:hypothetical protein RB595_000983 [Gaeumannomyces hyphopodioides]